jgi:flagellar biosynthesis protein FliP
VTASGATIQAASQAAQHAAQQAAAGLPVVIGSGAAGQLTLPLPTLMVLAAITLLPALALMMSAFTRIYIVLSLLRQALGTPMAPPNQVILGLSLFLTFFVMQPQLEQVHERAWKPYVNGQMAGEQALSTGIQPLREFMRKQTRPADLALFTELSRLPKETAHEQLPLPVVVSAFITSELKSAFQIGFMIFIPFLVIDLVVASVLMSLGMVMMSPLLVALPFKLMLFVLADGWNLLLGSLAASFVR